MAWIEGRSAFIDHVKLRGTDLAALEEVENLTLWAVELAEPRLLARLERLRILDWRGGRVEDLAEVSECKQVKRLGVSHNRKLQSLDFLREMRQLEGLELYALPRVSDLAPLVDLPKLRRIDLGAMRSVSSLAPLLEITSLEALFLINRVGIDRAQIEQLRSHPTLSAIGWWCPDEPRWTLESVEGLGLPKPRLARFGDPLWLPGA